MTPAGRYWTVVSPFSSRPVTSRQEGGAEALARGGGDGRPAALGPGQLEAAARAGGPVQPDVARLHRKRAELDGVGGQFVQGQREGVGGAGREEEVGALPTRLAGSYGPQFGRGQVVDGGAAPPRGGEKLVRAGHGLQPAAEGLQEGVERRGALGRLLGQGLDGGQHVLHPVVQLGHELLALVVLEVGEADVLDDAGQAQRGSGLIPRDDARQAQPDEPLVGRPNEPEPDVEGVGRLQRRIPLGDEGRDVVGVRVTDHQAAGVFHHLARREAGDGGHALRHRERPARQVPFELAEARDLEG